MHTAVFSKSRSRLWWLATATFLVFGAGLWFMSPIPKSLPAFIPKNKWLPPRPDTIGGINQTLIIPVTHNDNVEWVNVEQLSAFVPVIYCMDNIDRPECHEPITRQGREAAAYLSFIVQFYDELPNYNIFIHADAMQWHNDIFGEKTEHLLTAIRYEAVDKLGYMNLRCLHNPGCPAGVSPHDPPKGEIADDGPRARYSSIYQELFGVPESDVPETIGYVCCAQFIVTREQIRQRPVEDYKRILDWLGKAGASDSHEKGWIIETMWHIIFKQPPVLCPEFDQCRCDLYGWCGPYAKDGQTRQAIGS